MRDLESAKVSVYPHFENGKQAYTYVVENTGSESITEIGIGYDYYIGSSLLTGILPLQVISPEGWNYRIVYLEESNDYEVWWVPSNSTNRSQSNKDWIYDRNG